MMGFETFNLFIALTIIGLLSQAKIFLTFLRQESRIIGAAIRWILLTCFGFGIVYAYLMALGGHFDPEQHPSKLERSVKQVDALKEIESLERVSELVERRRTIGFNASEAAKQLRERFVETSPDAYAKFLADETKAFVRKMVQAHAIDLAGVPDTEYYAPRRLFLASEIERLNGGNLKPTEASLVEEKANVRIPGYATEKWLVRSTRLQNAEKFLQAEMKKALGEYDEEWDLTDGAQVTDGITKPSLRLLTDYLTMYSSALVNGLYLSFCSFATLGDGRTVARSLQAKLAMTLQIVVSIIIVSVVLGSLGKTGDPK